MAQIKDYNNQDHVSRLRAMAQENKTRASAAYQEMSRGLEQSARDAADNTLKLPDPGNFKRAPSDAGADAKAAAAADKDVRQKAGVKGGSPTAEAYEQLLKDKPYHPTADKYQADLAALNRRGAMAGRTGVEQNQYEAARRAAGADALAVADARASGSQMHPPGGATGAGVRRATLAPPRAPVPAAPMTQPMLPADLPPAPAPLPAGPTGARVQQLPGRTRLQQLQGRMRMGR